MNVSVAFTCALIVLARITDVSLDTVRTVAIVQGRRGFAAILGFFEAVIYVSAVAKVLLNINHPAYVVAYGLGFALGTFLGITIEQRLAFGQQLASLFTSKGVALTKGLSEAGYRLAQVQAHVRDGDASIVYVEIPRKDARKLIRAARAIDESCVCIVNDVRVAALTASRASGPARQGEPR